MNPFQDFSSDLTRNRLDFHPTRIQKYCILEKGSSIFACISKFKTMNITAHIDIRTAKGRKIVQELERNKKIVEIENPMPVGEDGLPLVTYSVEESFEKLWDKMEDHYSVDIRNL